ncbi:MAG: hypothetical protein M1821_008097 [Bathelium mastoideum]|nr:MAG: hypothetical protein M1821_008097 [Bathelium mastoideum]
MPGTARSQNLNPAGPSTQAYLQQPLLPRGQDPQDYGLSGDVVSATSGHNHIVGTFFSYGTPQTEQLQQQTQLPEQYAPNTDAYAQPSVQTQIYAPIHAPPTPMSASQQGQQTFNFNQYPTAVDTSFPTSSPNHSLEQQQIRPEWRTNLFDGQIGHQQQQQQHTPQYPPTEYSQAYAYGYNYLSTPITPSQELHTSSHTASRPAGIWYHPPPDAAISPTQNLDQAAIENEDDEYYDVQSDEEMDVDPTQASLAGHSSRDLGQLLTLNQANTDELHARRFDAFLYQGILDQYRAEWVASPLKNPQTARVFAHFVHITGPTMSIFERHARNTSAFFSDDPVPRYQQGLWTYVMPIMALHNQGLLHAMLALASIHIAKIQHASITPSFKHYAYSLKRVRYCLGHSQKRNQIATLAASLLLGFYEIMAAEHSKWSSHLAGARQLLNEIDYAGMHKELRRRKAERKAYDAFEAQRTMGLEYPHNLRRRSQQWYVDEVPDIDETIISHFMGHEVRYDEYGQVYGRYSVPKKIPADLDLRKFEVWQDLHWWYCKQDIYQSIVSGNQLIRDFRRWSDCPPRAPIGQDDAVVGTSDHLWLLLARVADFAAKDRERKLKVLSANGGVWKPPEGSPLGAGQPPKPTNPPNTSGTASSPANSSSAPPGRPPGIPMPQMPFYGMAPSSEVRMPSSYASRQDPYAYHPQSPPSSPESSAYDIPAATTAALTDWSRIQAALSSFPTHLGPYFQPLTAEEQFPVATPFGPALVYRSFDIACMWAVYYMAQIILLRSHPSMPAAAMLAQGVAAAQTAPHALAIGRIAAGIVPNPMPPAPFLNASLGAGLTESTMPLFFAGVQYREFAQREWLVSRVRNIEERTGWASAGLIASGCEKAWVKAYEAGRGPPWELGRVAEDVVDERKHWATGYRWYRADGTMMGRAPAGEEGGNGRPGSAAGEGTQYAEQEQQDVDQTDRSLLGKSDKARLHWAMGIIGMEEDAKTMSRE